MRDAGEFETIPDMWKVYGEPCSNCRRYIKGAYCFKRHRQQRVTINKGHIPEVVVRRKGGCPDHKMKVGDWWGEDPIKPHSATYGGTKTNFLV